MRKITLTVLTISIVLLGGRMLSQPVAYEWSEKLYVGDALLGSASRTITFYGGTPETQSLQIKLSNLPEPPVWLGDVSIAPRAILATQKAIYVITTPWLARGQFASTPRCVYVFEYTVAGGAWRLMPTTRELPYATVAMIASPSTFLRFEFPSKFSFSRAVKAITDSAGRVVHDDFDIATAPTIAYSNKNLCN